VTPALCRTIWVLAAFALTGQSRDVVPLEAGMILDRSVTIRPGTYRLSAPEDLARPVITVRGQGITVDFNGAVRAGGPEQADPDTYAGLAVLIDGGSKVTIKNAVVRGFKVSILARRSPDIHLAHNDYISGRALEDGVDRDRFAISPEGTTTLPTGEYTLQVISDDDVRVWMDGAMILDDWAAHESKVSRVPVGEGRHRFKVEYYDVTGFAELRFDIQRK
jgi:PA14 domain